MLGEIVSAAMISMLSNAMLHSSIQNHRLRRCPGVARLIVACRTSPNGLGQPFDIQVAGKRIWARRTREVVIANEIEIHNLHTPLDPRFDSADVALKRCRVLET